MSYLFLAPTKLLTSIACGSEFQELIMHCMFNNCIRFQYDAFHVFNVLVLPYDKKGWDFQRSLRALGVVENPSQGE